MTIEAWTKLGKVFYLTNLTPLKKRKNTKRTTNEQRTNREKIKIFKMQ